MGAAIMIETRTSRDEWFLDLAHRCAQQATCLRRRYGAVIVDDRGTVVSTGYCGAPRDIIDCLQIGKCWRADHNIPAGTNYDKCRSAHAEWNAIMQAGKYARGSTMYISGFDANTGELVGAEPCFICTKMIVNAGISAVIIRHPLHVERIDPVKLYVRREREAFA